jgi:hypothetical protein
VSIAVCLAVLVLLSAGVVASVVIVVFGDPEHSVAWKQGYNDSWSVAKGTPTPPSGADRGATVAGCSSAVAALGSRPVPGPGGTTFPPIPPGIRASTAKTKDYRAGWTKGCADFFLTRHKNTQ